MYQIKYEDENHSLLIRPLETQDAKIIYQEVLANLDQLKPFMDWSHAELSTEKQAERIQLSRLNFASRYSFDFSVFDSKTNQFLMSASLIPGRVMNKRALSVGYWTASEHHNKGLATIVTKLLVILGFENLGSDRIEIVCNKANEKSKKVIEKCQFRFEGELRNYFTEGTQTMLSNGYNPERNALMYAFIPEDRQSLEWYELIKSSMKVTT